MKNRYWGLLEVLAAAGEAKNFQEAARELGMSQAAVSLKLRELERLSPLPVFQLKGKKKVLTKYGQELCSVAKLQFLEADQHLERLNRKYYTAENLVLRVGGRKELCEYLAPRFAFQGSVEFHSYSSHDAVLALRSHAIDLAITYEKPDSSDIFAKKVLVSRAQLICHKRWLKKGDLNLATAGDLEFLRRTPSILYERDGHLLRDWLRYLGVNFDVIRKRFIVQDWRTIISLVEQGYGYGLVPDYIVSKAATVKSILLPDAALPKFTFYALYYRDLRDVDSFSKILDRLV